MLAHLLPVLVYSNHGRLEGGESFEKYTLHLANTVRTPTHVVHAVKRVLSSIRPRCIDGRIALVGVSIPR